MSAARVPSTRLNSEDGVYGGQEADLRWGFDAPLGELLAPQLPVHTGLLYHQNTVVSH